MWFTLHMLRQIMRSGLVLALAACLLGIPMHAASLLKPVESSDDKCPDGSKKDPLLGCRQTSRLKKKQSSNATTSDDKQASAKQTGTTSTAKGGGENAKVAGKKRKSAKKPDHADAK